MTNTTAVVAAEGVPTTAIILPIVIVVLLAVSFACWRWQQRGDSFLDVRGWSQLRLAAGLRLGVE